MSLFKALQRREAAGRPIQIGVIGAGTFGEMFLSQARLTPGMRVAGVADLDVKKAGEACRDAGWPAGAVSRGDTARSTNDGAAAGKLVLTEDPEALIGAELDVVVEATGKAEAGAQHARAAIEQEKHVVMVNIEADALVGPALAKRAAEKGVVYSLAYGDQPAIIHEMVDWARTAGLEVVCAGKGTRYQPEYRYSTPETVWGHFGFSAEQLASGRFNPQMYNSFLDGTKSAIEMCALANATGLVPQKSGLNFPPVGAQDAAQVLKPVSAGGSLEHSGTVEVTASEQRDGSPISDHMRWGVYVVFRATSEQMRRFLRMHEFTKDDTGEYGAVYRSYHLIGLELGISVATAALRGEATGTADFFIGDVAAAAKKDLKAGETLDGEGGYTVYGKLARTEESIPGGYLPIGLSRGGKVRRAVKKDAVLSYGDVAVEEGSIARRLRRELEEEFRAGR